MKCVCLMTVLTCALSAFGDVDRDVAFWWRYQSNGASSGAATPDQFKNLVACDEPSGVSFLNAEGFGPQFTYEDVPESVRGTIRKNTPCLYMTQPTNWIVDASGDKKLVSYAQGVRILEKEAVPTSDATFFIRFKWEGRQAPASNLPTPYNYQVRLFDNAFNYTVSSGWYIILASYGGLPGNAWARVEVGHSGVTANNTSIVTPENIVEGKIVGDYMDFYDDGTWYTFAVTLKTAPEENRTYIDFYKSVGNVPKIFHAKAFVGELIKMRTLENRTSTLFRSGDYTTAQNVSTNAASGLIGNFRGKIDEIKIWNRALSEKEVRVLLAGNAPLWSIGTENGSAAEFSDADPAAVFDPETMTYSRFRKTLTAEAPSVTVAFDVPTNAIAMKRVLRVKPVGEVPQEARMSAKLNGSPVGTFPLRGKNGGILTIPASAWDSCVDHETGDAEIVLERCGDVSGEITLDFVELGGSWQLGYRDGDCSEFVWSGCNAVWPAGRSRESMTANLYRNKSLDIYFPLSAAMAENCSYNLSLGFNHTYYNLPVTLTLNGETIYSADLQKSNTVNLRIDPGTLDTANVLRLSTGDSDSSSDVLGIDFIRFEVHRLKGAGTVVVVR